MVLGCWCRSSRREPGAIHETSVLKAVLLPVPVLVLQDAMASAPADEALPDPSAIHLTLNSAAITELRSAKQQASGGAGGGGLLGPGSSGLAATGGLWRCSAEWAGLSCRHSGAWQLSLVYEPEELARFSLVRRCTWW